MSANEYKLASSTNNGRFNAASEWGTRHYTDSGYIHFGPANSGHAHIYTDRPDFYFNKELVINGNTVWNSGNDGSGSGLDADLLDGEQGSYYAQASLLNNYLPLTGGTLTGGLNVASGNVGIGTTSPSRELEVQGGGNVDIRVAASTDNDSSAIELQNTQETWTIRNVDTNNDAFEIDSSTADNIVTIYKTGKVGIGTCHPSSPLEVNVGLNSLKISGRDTYIDSTIDSANANIYVTQAGVGDFSQEAGHLVLQARTQGTVYRDIIFAGGLANGEALMTINGQGNVGIGTTNPEKALHINSGISNIGIRVESTDATSSIEFMDSGTTSSGTSARVGGINNDFFVQTNGSERMRIDSSGRVGIGTTIARS